MTLVDRVRRLTASRTELEADEERRISHRPGCCPVRDLVPRRRATVAGKVAALTYRPKDRTPAVTARLTDGTGTIDLIFLGRREVRGVAPGRRLVAEGMVCDENGRPAMFNPNYRLLPRGSAEEH